MLVMLWNHQIKVQSHKYTPGFCYVKLKSTEYCPLVSQILLKKYLYAKSGIVWLHLIQDFISIMNPHYTG